MFHKEEPVTKTTRYGKSILLTKATIADNTSKIELALWDDDSTKISLGNSYKLSMLTVKSFENFKSLSMTSASSVTEIEDIGHINIDEIQEVNNPDKIKGTSSTVSVLTKHYCLHCNSPITIQNMTTSIICCNKCGQKMLKKNLKTTLTLKLSVQDVFVTAYNDIIVTMLKNEGKENLVNDIQELEILLLEKPVEVYHVNGIAKSITLG